MWNPSRMAAVALLVCMAGCAGYQIGNRSLYPPHIRNVYVPLFESASYRRGLAERLTEAVMKEIELKTPYKVTDDAGADSVLIGRILADQKRQTVAARSGDPREVQVGLRVEVSWVDRQGATIRPDRSVPLPAEFTRVEGRANLVAEVGQSVATAQQQAINRTAEQIVALMESPW